MARFPAAFINCIADEGDKAEAIEFLQQTWDDLMSLRLGLTNRGFEQSDIDYMTKFYTYKDRVYAQS